MSPSFCICRRTSDNDDCGIAPPVFCHTFPASLFFVFHLTSTLYSLEALRCKTCHTRRTSRLLPCLARWCFILRMCSACFPPRGDDIAPTVCPYLIAALNGSSQQCFRYRHARRAFAPFMRRLPLIRSHSFYSYRPFRILRFALRFWRFAPNVKRRPLRLSRLALFCALVALLCLSQLFRF